jgi:hypothetical protein
MASYSSSQFSLGVHECLMFNKMLSNGRLYVTVEQLKGWD